MARESYVDSDALAAYLGVSRRTIEDWVHRRDVPFHKVGRLVRFRLSEIDTWIAQRTQATVEPSERHLRAVGS
jgi:excisionase family DNA binding protein